MCESFPHETLMGMLLIIIFGKILINLLSKIQTLNFTPDPETVANLIQLRIWYLALSM